MHTLSELSEEKFLEFVVGSGVPPDPPEPPEPEDTSAFALEKYLEEFIVSNFHEIFNRELKIYEDEDGMTASSTRPMSGR